MISANSRYAAASVVPGNDIDGNDILVVIPPAPTDTTIQYRYHQVTGTDNVDMLAYQNYGDPTLWWQIANANPEVTNWSALVIGTLIRIPTLTSA